MKLLERWCRIRRLCPLILAFFAVQSHSQVRVAWIRTYGGPGGADCFKDIYAVSDGGYVMTGRAYPIGVDPDSVHLARPDVWVVKTDRDGELDWQQTYDLFDQRDSDVGNSIVETDDGGFIIGGRHGNDPRDFTFIGLKIDGEGEIEWSRGYGEELPARCLAVIEAKSGQYLLGGIRGHLRETSGYAVMVDRDGDVIWEENYDPDVLATINSIRESPQGGFLLAGADGRSDFSLVKINDEGEVIWNRGYHISRGVNVCMSLASVDDDYTLAGYNLDGDALNFCQARVDGEGNLIWQALYESDNSQDCKGHATMWDGGSSLVGGSVFDGQDNAHIKRTDAAGNVVWEQSIRVGGLYSTVEDHEGYIIMAGDCPTEDVILGRQGMIVKVVPEHSPPHIVEYHPEDLDLTVLLDDSIRFWVRAVDLQDDSLRYLWRLDGDSLTTDTSVTVPFDDLGGFDVYCSVSDGENADSVSWHIMVSEFFIRGHLPEALEMTVRRDSTVAFAVDVAAVEGEPVEYRWWLEDSLVGETPSVEVRFPEVRDRPFVVEAEAFRGELSDAVQWRVWVKSAVWAWWPRGLRLRVPVDTTVCFGVEPFDPESDSLEIWWRLDGDTLAMDTTEVEVAFPETGGFGVAVCVRNGGEADTIRWAVEVYDPAGVDQQPEPLHPGEVVFYEPSPNPFNAAVRLGFGLPRAGDAKLCIYDIYGRRVAVLCSGRLAAGGHVFVWDGGGCPSGVYLAVLEAGESMLIRKVALVK